MTRFDRYGDRICMVACWMGIAYIVVWHLLL